MLAAEKRAAAGEPIPATTTEHADSYFRLTTPSRRAKPVLATALLPFAALIFCLLAGLWWNGGGFGLLDKSILNLFSFNAWRQIITQAKDTTLVLMIAAGISLLLAIDQARRARLSWQQTMQAVFTGIKSSSFPLLLLILAWSLKSACDDLNTGEFLVATVGQSVQPWLFPLLVFLVAALTSFGTGTSWGTMAILIPTAIPVAYQLDGGSYGLITMISLGAVLDGSIFGDHCSPISDTTIMSSIASGCDHIQHVQTQIPYSLTVGSVALLGGYLPAAMNISPLIIFPIATALLFIILFTIGKQVVSKR